MAKKETTKSFILRLDTDTMAAVEKWAADEFRSINGQIQWLITEALRKNHRLPKKRPAAISDEGKQRDEPKKQAETNRPKMNKTNF